jgi:hypothetical protein
VIIPLRSLLIIASPEDSTIAASRWVASFSLALSDVAQISSESGFPDAEGSDRQSARISSHGPKRVDLDSTPSIGLRPFSGNAAGLAVASSAGPE